MNASLFFAALWISVGLIAAVDVRRRGHGRQYGLLVMLAGVLGAAHWAAVRAGAMRTEDDAFRIRTAVRVVLYLGAALGLVAIPAAVDFPRAILGLAMFLALALGAANSTVLRLRVDNEGVEINSLLGTRRINFTQAMYSTLQIEAGVRTLPIMTLRMVPKKSEKTRPIVVRTFWWTQRHEMTEVLRQKIPA